MPNLRRSGSNCPVRKFLERSLRLVAAISNYPVILIIVSYEDINWIALVGCLGHRSPTRRMGYPPARPEQTEGTRILVGAVL